MFFFIADSKDILQISTNEETFLKFWINYWTYRYDFNFSFCDFLRENGIYAKKVPQWFVLSGGGTIDIEICPN